MASKAPFGNDIQREFDIKLIGGKLVQVPTSIQHNDTRHSSIYKRKAKETTTDMAAVRAHRHLQDVVGRADGKRMSSVKTKRLRKLLLTINEEKQQEDTEYLTFDQLLSPRKQHARSEAKHRAGFGSVLRGQTHKSSKKKGLADLVSATNRQKQMAMLNILEPAVAPLLNRVRSVEDVLQSCTRLDEKRVGVLETSYVTRVFRSFGIKFSERDLFKLAELTDSSLGSDHILYRKLCGRLVSIFSGETLNLDAINEKSTSTHTPCVSVETYSPGSVEDYELSINRINDILQNDHQVDNNKLPPLTTTSSQHFRKSRPRAAINNLSKMTNTQSSSLHTQLPGITHKVSYTSPPLQEYQHSYASASASRKEGHETQDGSARLQCALESCADEKGIIIIRVTNVYHTIWAISFFNCTPPTEDYIQCKYIATFFF